MPLTAKGEKIKAHMEEEYGEKKGEEVFYASRNKGTITGVDMAKAKDDGDLILEHFSGSAHDSDDDYSAQCDAVISKMDALSRRMDAAECGEAEARMDKGHWVAKTNIPAGGKIERKIKQGH